MTVIGMLEGRMSVNYIAVAFGVHRTTIWRLAQRFRTTGTANDRPRSGRPKRLTPREERYIKITAGRDHFLLATRIVDRVRRATGVHISAQAVRNKIKACRFKSIRPHKCMDLTVHHKIQRHAWTNQKLRRNWRTVFFSDESRFTLKFADGRIRVWRRTGERFATVCVMPVGGS
jgi:transposase